MANISRLLLCPPRGGAHGNSFLIEPFVSGPQYRGPFYTGCLKERQKEEFMLAVQIATLVIITVNLFMDVSYRRRIDKLEARIEALETMLGSSH